MEGGIFQDFSHLSFVSRRGNDHPKRDYLKGVGSEPIGEISELLP